jgi:hypothetical protein
MREIAIFESQKHYVQRISHDEKINIFKSIWPNSLHTFGEITLLFDDIMYTSKSIEEILNKQKKKKFINNILSCNLF